MLERPCDLLCSVTAGDIDGRTKDFGMLLSLAEGRPTFGKIATKDIGDPAKDIGPLQKMFRMLLSRTAVRALTLAGVAQFGGVHLFLKEFSCWIHLVFIRLMYVGRPRNHAVTSG